MENPNKKVLDIDEKPYGRKGIEEMIERLNSIDDEAPSDKPKGENIA